MQHDSDATKVIYWRYWPPFFLNTNIHTHCHAHTHTFTHTEKMQHNSDATKGIYYHYWPPLLLNTLSHTHCFCCWSFGKNNDHLVILGLHTLSHTHTHCFCCWSVGKNKDHLVILGLGLVCGYKNGWSGQFLPKRFLGSVDREWWRLFRICLCCFSSLVCAVQLLLSCWLHRFLCPCEQNDDVHYFPLSHAVCSHVTMLMLKAFSETFSVSPMERFPCCCSPSLRELMAWLADYMPCPAKLRLHQDGVNAG